jgi:membrane-associated protease RseP (regulator of RpoE activity)
MTDKEQYGAEATHYRNRRILTVVGVILGLLLACGFGMVLGGALVYGGLSVTDQLASDREQPRVVIERQEIEEAIPEELERWAPLPGAVIVEVMPDTPAEAAGLEAGDVILAVDDEALESGEELADVIAGYEPGDRVALEIRRPGEGSMTVRVRLGEHPERDGAAYLGVTYSVAQMPGSQLGPRFRVEPFDPDQMPFALPDVGSMEGALVMQVSEDSPAAAAGLQSGDLITALDGEAIEGPEGLTEAVADHQPGDEVTLTVYRLMGGEEREVRVTLAEHPDEAGRAYLGVAISGMFHMERFGEPGGQQRFWFRQGPGDSEAPLDQLPFGLDQLPFGLDQLPFDPDQLPFDPGDLDLEWGDL